MDKQHILIIEDNPISRKILKSSLETEGYGVVEVTDASSGIQAAQKKNFDLIIQDLFLPDMDGFVLNKKLSTLPGYEKTPIFVLSGILVKLDEEKKLTEFSTFLLKPVEPAYLLEVVRAHLPITAPSTPLFGKGKHLLIADDNPIQLKLFNMQLSNAGFKVSTALDGIIALQKAKEDPPDAIISDILMPNMDGFSLCLEIKRDPKLNVIPVILLTSHYLANEDLALAKEVGASGYLTRTPDIDRLLAELQKILHTKTPLSSNSSFELTKEIKEKHATRSIRQLEQQVFDNQKLERRCAILVSQLSLIVGIANALTTKNKEIDESLKEVFYFCLYATGVSKGALYLKASDNTLVLSNYLGYTDTEKKNLETFFGLSSSIRKMIQKDKPFTVPSETFSGPPAVNFLNEAKVKSAFIVPMFSNDEFLGLLYLGSDLINFSGENTREFIHSLGTQFGLSIALTTAFNKLDLSVKHLEVQYAIALIFAESTTLFTATSKMLKIICERLKWDCGTIWAVDKQSNVLRCTRVWQMPNLNADAFLEASQNLTLIPGMGLAGKTWETRKAAWQSEIYNDKNFLRKESAAKAGLHTGISFPIIYENEILGVIEFFSKEKIKLDQELLLWFESIGNQFGLFLMRKNMENEMLYLAEHDVLTGLSNRNLLEQGLNSKIITAKDRNEKLAIIFIDLDHFKYINDSMGHDVGDILLKEISIRFRECLRPQDIISRLGGDEFVIVLPHEKQKQEVIDIISRLQDILKSKIFLKGKEVFITASMGVSFYPEDGNTVQSLIKGADIAMYSAKEKGRNTYQFCTPEMTVKAENVGILQNNLRQAFINNEFLLHYQPKIDVKTKRVSGIEALIRWNRPDGILLPSTFISAIENSDLITPVSEWVLKTAYLQNKIWQTQGLPMVTMSVNISVLNLNKKLLDTLENILRETKLAPNSFEIEITESMLMINVENNIQFLRSLKEMGVKISIDDFGTGYSSLSYLKRFPIDILKIDQSFIKDIVRNTDDASIVRAIIAMAHSLGLKVIAEGVETEAQLKFLCEHDCDEIQGFYFSRPLSATAATDFIKNAKIDWNF